MSYQVPGTYVIACSVVASGNQTIHALLKDMFYVFGIHIGSTNRKRIEIISRTISAVGSKVAIVLDPFYDMVYSDSRHQTSLKGFLYKSHRNESISWFVTCVLTNNVTESVDPVKFDTVLINKESGWNINTNTFLASLSGVYYAQLTVGIASFKPNHMELLINGLPRINFCRNFALRYGWDTCNRAAILRLQNRDKLYKRLPSGYYLQHHGNKYTAFV